jgi:hypothetical protein
MSNTIALGMAFSGSSLHIDESTDQASHNIVHLGFWAPYLRTCLSQFYYRFQCFLFEGSLGRPIAPCVQALSKDQAADLPDRSPFRLEPNAAEVVQVLENAHSNRL